MQQIVFLEETLTFRCAKVAAVQQLATQTGAVVLLEARHQLLRFLIRSLGGAAIIVFATPIFETDNEHAACDGSADITAPSDTGTETACQLERSFITQTERGSVSGQNRLGAIEARQKLLGRCIVFSFQVHLVVSRTNSRKFPVSVA